MENTLGFLSAALPWIATGLLLAIFFAGEASRKKKQEKQGEYGSEGIALGMCLGVAHSMAHTLGAVYVLRYDAAHRDGIQRGLLM